MSEQNWTPISWGPIGSSRLEARTQIHLARPHELMNDWFTACGRAVPDDFKANRYWSPMTGTSCAVCARIVAGTRTSARA